ncbi:MAG: hypothetical protein FJ222_11420 [Lentisphaerae bacterium]|nr:hypothetical protein [Lentisphaerota bacterium]
MKSKLICILAATLTTWSLRAGVNPQITDLDLSIAGVADYDEFYEPSPSTTPKGPGGFVCSNGWQMITLKAVGVNEPMQTRLNWDSSKIEIWTATNGGTQVLSPTNYSPASSMPTQLWVKGVGVSAYGPGKDASGNWTSCGPEHITLEAINNGADPDTPGTYYDRVAFTVYQVAAITVTPKGVPEDWTPPDPVTIGAGAIRSPAHQADVTIQVLPAVAGIPIDVSLIGGLSHEPGKAAELVMGSLAATGGCAAVTVLTGTNGAISGELTSSDVNNMDCTIRAGATETRVRFTWDEYFEQDAWTFEPGYLPVPGVLTNHLVLRHHRDGAESASTNGMPWKPFNGHDIRFFVEKVEYWDAEGNLCETNNTAEAPADLSAWATFPEEPVTTDADACVTQLLTIVTNANLQSVTLAAYDWSVWVSPAPAAPVAPLSGFGFRALAAPAAPLTSSSTRTDHTIVTAGQVAFSPHIAFQPQEVPLHEEGSSTSGFGGLLVIYLANLNANSANWTFAIQTNTATGWSTSVPQAVAKIDQVLTGIPGGVNYIAPNLTPDKFNFYRIIVREPARYQVKIFYQSTVKWTFEFDTVAGKLDFAGLNAHDPIILTTNRLNYVLFPLTNSAMASASLVVTGKVVANLPNGSPKDIYTIGHLDAGSKFKFTSMRTPNFQMSGLSEGDNHVLGKFTIKTKGIRKRINSIANGMMIVITDMAATEARSGSFTNLHLVCPNMHNASPTGTLPPDGENGARYSPETSPLFVFDEPDEIGKCLMACETPRLTGLSSAFVKSLVWNNVEWVHPSVSTVTSVTSETPSGEPWKTEFRYNTMPTHNNDFGNKNLVLRFKDRHTWKWDQPVQFRFARTGTNAASRVIEAGVLSTNYVSAGNPNWYVYWQQVANQFNFGPQTRMSYTNLTSATTPTEGQYLYVLGSPWVDSIRIYDANKSSVFKFTTTIHHENGHRQSMQLPADKGGWGDNLAYILANDTDRDGIRDSWETAPGHGSTLGFSVTDEDDAEARELDKKRRAAWEHGWDSLEDAALGLLGGFYTNPGGFDPSTGRGLTPRNEEHVRDNRDDIKAKDWSHVPVPE